MRNDYSFRRGGFESSSEQPDLLDPHDFAQVPVCFTQGLSPEQWKAMQETYQQAWGRACRKIDESSDSADGGLNYQI
jgi:hypothetical protein